MFDRIITALILNGIFIFGSILTLYCLWILWGRWSIRNKGLNQKKKIILLYVFSYHIML